MLADADAIVAAHASIDARDLAPPALAPTDVVGGLLDREFRDYVRSLSTEATMALAQEIVDGKATRAMVDALSRSPLPLPSVLRDVLPGAREAALLRDNPAQARLAREGREHVAWLAERIQQAQGALPRVAGTARQQLDVARDAAIGSRG